ncbi:hypothetical protein BD779DRAFT_1538108 [Infundibulicybe gibba]|nr:hypothetical protein BD779DRAFT_1538108 [Infundibulicybe gibba]
MHSYSQPMTGPDMCTKYWRTSSSPIAKIPRELILEIIRLAADDSGIPRRAVPAIASQVCAHWRAIILAALLLWSTIEITNTLTDQRELGPQLARASVYTTRSSPHTIRLFVYLRPLPSCAHGGRNAARAIAEFLDTHMHRVRELSLQLAEGFRLTEIGEMVPRTYAPLLQSCTIAGAPTVDFADQDWHAFEPPALPWLESNVKVSESPIADTFAGLERLSLRVATVAWARFAPRNLRSLDLQVVQENGRPTWAELCAVLQANAHTLTHLRIAGALPLDPSPSRPTLDELRAVQQATGLAIDLNLSAAAELHAVTLPALTALSLGGDHIWAVTRFAAMARVPALDTLALHDIEYDEGPRDKLAFLALIECLPLCRVRRLHLSCVSFGFWHEADAACPIITATGWPPELFPRILFSHVANIHTLTLTFPDTATMEALAHAPPGGAPPMPRLARLVLPYATPADMKVLAQRERAGAPRLEELWVESCARLGPSMGTDVARIVVKGRTREDEEWYTTAAGKFRCGNRILPRLVMPDVSDKDVQT